MKRTIGIIGPIGSFKYRGEQINGIQLVDVIAKVSSLPSDTTELVVEYDTPGGRKDVGMAIYHYLKSIQPRIQVTSKQIGDIGSIGTVAWFSGSKRIAMKGKEFMIHNPWTPHAEGDAAALQKEADEMKLTEDEMTSFYIERTGITKEGISPLMKAETSFGADKAVELKFATETYEAQNQAAYQYSKPINTMSKISKMALDAILALLPEEDKVKVKAALAVAPPAELMGKAVMIDGKGATDGIYTVVGGVITALDSVQEKAAEPAATSAAAASAIAKPDAKLDEVLAMLKAQPATPEAIAKIVSDQVAAQMTLIKKSIKTDHVPVAFTPETKADDAKEWDRSFKANEHAALKKSDPEKYQRLFYSKYGKMPNM